MTRAALAAAVSRRPARPRRDTSRRCVRPCSRLGAPSVTRGCPRARLAALEHVIEQAAVAVRWHRSGRETELLEHMPGAGVSRTRGGVDAVELKLPERAVEDDLR